MFAKLVKSFLSVPAGIPATQRRAYFVVLLASFSGGISHFMYMLFFAAYGAWPPVFFNIGSVILFFCAVAWLRRRGDVSSVMLLISTEFITHQWFVVYYFGWGYGFEYFLFMIASLVFLVRYRSRWIPLSFAFFSVSVFGWLYVQGQYLNAPHPDMLVHLKGTLFWTNLYSGMLGLAMVGYVYSRTAAQMERELEAQNRELRETQLRLVNSEKMAAIGKLAAGLAHEINNPIGAIHSSAQTGVRAVERLQNGKSNENDADPKTARILTALGQSLNSTMEASERLSKLAGRLQGFIGVDEAEFKSADLHEGLENTLAILESQLAERQIEVLRSFDDSLPMIFCRPAEINQVFMHLLQNAIDAIDREGHIGIETSHSKENVAIRISDNGRGLHPEEIAGLFDLGFSSGESRVKLGMGLPISHQIVSRHKGRIDVESVPGEGTAFTVVLPKETVDR